MPAFLHHDVNAIETNPDPDHLDAAARDRIIAWELDSVSGQLSNLWMGKKFKPEMGLSYIVLEDNSFSGVDFSRCDFTGSILYDAKFDKSIFKGANLTNASLRNLIVDGANFGEVSNFTGSSWQGTRWWTAEKISPELCTYLRNIVPYPPGLNKLPDGCI
jgi:uncharacterized protein YjbI with pentapeptide repeats